MNKQLIEECKAIYNQFTGIGDDEDYMWQEVIDYASNQQNSALLAQIEELRNTIITATNNGAELDNGTWVYSIDTSALSKTPQQSLSSLKSSVEEEVIERCAKFIDDDFGYESSWGDQIRHLIRKYKEEG